MRDNTSAQDIIETRLLIHHKEGWVALPYIWDRGKTDAILTVTGGTHCHQPDIGTANTSGLHLEHYRPFGTAVGECRPPVAAGIGAGDLDCDIVPGNAAASIMDFRMDSNEPGVRMDAVSFTRKACN